MSKRYVKGFLKVLGLLFFLIFGCGENPNSYYTVIKLSTERQHIRRFVLSFLSTRPFG